MKQDIRVKKLLSELKEKYKIRDKIYIKIINKEITGKSRRYMLLSITKSGKITIKVFVNNFVRKFEKISDATISEILAHEIVHLLIYQNKKEKNPKKLREVLKIIDSLIDYIG